MTSSHAMAFSTGAFRRATTRLCFATSTLLSLIGGSSANMEGIAVGNSYTYYCQPDITLKQLLDEGNGVDSTVIHRDPYRRGGASINSQKPHTAALLNSKSSLNKLLDNKPDFLILQDQSQIPALGEGSGQYRDCREGTKIFRENMPLETDLILYMTWGRRNNAWKGCFSNNQEDLRLGYEDYRDYGLQAETGGSVYIAPVGLAFKEVHDQYCVNGTSDTSCEAPGVTAGCAAATTGITDFTRLYSGDGSHPHCGGCYLSALVFYSMLTGRSPVGLSGNYSTYFV